MSIASASTTVKFHELPSGNVLHSYQPGTKIDGPIRSISWSKDGNWLALVPYSGFAEILSVKEQLKLIHTISSIEEPSCAVFQNTTKKNIAVGTKNGLVLVYDVKTRSVKKTYPRTTSAIRKIQFTAKDGHIVAASDSGEVFIYSNIQNTLSGSFKIPRSSSITALRTNPIKRNYVVAGSEEGVVAVWDIHSNKYKFFIGSHKASVTDVVFSPTNSDLVISTALDRQICLYDIGISKCIGNIFVENSITSVDFSPDGCLIIMASQKGNISVYDYKNIQVPLYSFSGHNSSVSVLFHKKYEDYEPSFSIPTESAGEVHTPMTPKNTSIAFEALLASGNSTSASSQKSIPVDDSFINAIKLSQTSTILSDQEENPASTNESQKSTAKTPTFTNSKFIQERLLGASHTTATSTPDAVPNICNFSPIIAGNDQCNGGNKLYIKEAVKEEMSGFVKEVKIEMKNNLEKIYKMYLSLIMSNVKESVKLEEQINILRTDLLAYNYSMHSLTDENEMLKQKILSLEQELALFRNHQNNNL